MRYSILIAIIALLFAAGCSGDDAEEQTEDTGVSADADASDVPSEPQPVSLSYTFDEDAEGWTSNVVEYTIGNDDRVAFRGEVRDLPSELDQEGGGYYLDAVNQSSDIFAYMKHPLGADDGLVPETEYSLEWTVEFATNYPANCPTYPSTDVFMKAGATKYEPARVESNDQERWELNYDKGNAEIGGPAATTLGNVFHDGDCMNADDFVAQTLSGTHTTNVETTAEGDMWLLLGIDSQIDEPLSIFIISIDVTIEPI